MGLAWAFTLAEWALAAAWLVYRLLYFALEVGLICVVVAWLARVQLLSFVLEVSADLDAVFGAIDVNFTWAKAPLRRIWELDAPIDTFTVTVRRLVIFSPPDPVASSADSAAPRAAPEPAAEREALLNVRSIKVHLTRGKGPRCFLAIVLVDELRLHFIAYDRRFRDTNVQRLAERLEDRQKGAARGGPRRGAAEGGDGQSASPRPTAPPASPDAPQALPGGDPPSAAPAAAPAAAGAAPGRPPPPPPPVVVECVLLRRVSVHVERRLGGRGAPRTALLPPILLHEERIEPARLEGGVSLGVLLWLNSLVLRTLAATSIDAVRSTLGAATVRAGYVVGRSLDIVDSANRTINAPGGSLVRGASGGVRTVVSGALEGTRAVVDGAAASAQEVAVGLSSGSAQGVLRGVHRGVTELSRGVGNGVDAIAHGAAGGAAALLDGVDECTANMGPAAHTVHGALGATKSVASGLAGCTRGVACGVASGSATVLGGVVGGTADAVAGLASGDLAGVVVGGGRLVGGVVGGTAAVVGGLSNGAHALSSGVGEGLEKAADGVGRTIDDVALSAAAGSRFIRPLARARSLRCHAAPTAEPSRPARARSAERTPSRSPPLVPLVPSLHTPTRAHQGGAGACADGRARSSSVASESSLAGTTRAMAGRTPPTGTSASRMRELELCYRAQELHGPM